MLHRCLLLLLYLKQQLPILNRVYPTLPTHEKLLQVFTLNFIEPLILLCHYFTYFRVSSLKIFRKSAFLSPSQSHFISFFTFTSNSLQIFPDQCAAKQFMRHPPRWPAQIHCVAGFCCCWFYCFFCCFCFVFQLYLGGFQVNPISDRNNRS